MGNPLAALPIVDKVLGIIQEWQKNKPINKLRYRVEAAISYIQLDERAGEYKDYTEEQVIKYKKHFRKRVFDE